MKDNEKRLLILASIFAIVAIIFSFLRLGFSISFFLIIVFWLIMFVGLFNRSEMVLRVEKYRIWVLIAAFLLSLIIISMLEPAVSSIQSTNDGEATTVLSADECKPIYEQYNDTIMDLSGDGITGTIGVQIDPNNCKAEINYNFVFSANLPKNFTPPNFDISEYKYAAGIISEENPDDVTGSAEIFALYNTSYQFGDPYDFGLPADNSNLAQQQMAEGASSSSFYTGWSRAYNFREDSMDKLQELNVFRVYDGKESMIVEEEEGGFSSYYLESEKAVENGDVVQEYEMTYSVRP